MISFDAATTRKVSASPALYEGNPSVTGGFPAHRASDADFWFDFSLYFILFYLFFFFFGGGGGSLKRLLNKQSRCRWFETPWRSCGVSLMALMNYLDLAFILVMLLVTSTLLRDYKGNSIDTRSLRHVRCRPFHGLLAQPQRQALACRWGFARRLSMSWKYDGNRYSHRLRESIMHGSLPITRSKWTSPICILGSANHKRQNQLVTGVGGPGVARLRSNHHRSTWLPLRRLPGSGGVVT